MASYNFIENSGIIVADTETLYDEVVSELQTALGSDLVTTADSPAGVLITAETTARRSVAEMCANSANQLNPNYAQGKFFDSIWALTGVQRTVATPTTVTATLTGVSGTVIPSGSIATTNDGDEFELIRETTIPASGTIDAEFQSVENGEIACAAGELINISSQVLGWETITNAEAGTLGVEEMSIEEARELRTLTLALQGKGTPEAIKSRLYALSDVKSLTFRENIADTTQTIDNVTMSAHSIYLCIDGGTDDEIAETLYNVKSDGAGFNGDTVVNYYDEESDQTVEIKFDRPTEVLIEIKVTVKVIGNALDVESQVKDAILAYTDSNYKQSGFKVGLDVSPFEITASIANETGFFVSDVQVAKQSDGIFQRETIDIEIFEKAVTSESLISVTVV